jgi:ChaB
MPRSRRRGLARAGELPGTLKRSSKDAQETFTTAHDNAVQAYGEGDQADQATYTEFKRKFEKRGDHWIPKQKPVPDLARAAASAQRQDMTMVPPCMRRRDLA